MAMPTRTPQPEEEPPASRFFENLRRGRFLTTCCPRCGTLHWQPRLVCPHCLARPLDWHALPHVGTIFAFSQTVAQPRRTVGIVELACGLRLVSSLEDDEGVAAIGCRVFLKIIGLEDGKISFTFVV
jgi:hypothetical protein